MGEGECQIPAEGKPKKSRNRKKHLYSTILQQMEFYFSDANLTKDRFLSQVLAKQSAVELDVFMKFNKIRKLNCTLDDIRKSVEKSELLGLDGDKVFRKTPVATKDNVEECTIYVENIQPDATHDSLSQIFTDFGKLAYVSIPKYRHNKANKGFAFIEYETEDSAMEALNFFSSIGCKLASDKNPEELTSIQTFEGDDQIEEEEETDKKRKHSPDNRETKRPKTEEENKIEPKEAEVAATTEEGKTKKKSKKEKRKNYIKELGLKVLSKKEWKKLRNRYLDLQRKKMKEFKHYLNKQKFSQKQENEAHEEEIETKISFTPGVIVKLNLPEPCDDVKKLKAELKAISNDVKYVDIPLPNGSDQVFIRFSTKEGAEQFCSQSFPGEKAQLTGDEETHYWEKIQTDRKVKFQKMEKKQRGRDKLLKKAEKESIKHMRFDEINDV